MRIHRAVPAFAVAITLAGGAAPAYAFDNRAPAFGPDLASPSAGASHNSRGSSDSLLDLGFAAVAGAAIGAGGVAVAGRRSSTAARRPGGIAARQS